MQRCSSFSFCVRCNQAPRLQLPQSARILPPAVNPISSRCSFSQISYLFIFSTRHSWLSFVTTQGHHCNRHHERSKVSPTARLMHSWSRLAKLTKYSNENVSLDEVVLLAQGLANSLQPNHRSSTEPSFISISRGEYETLLDTAMRYGMLTVYFYTKNSSNPADNLCSNLMCGGVDKPAIDVCTCPYSPNHQLKLAPSSSAASLNSLCGSQSLVLTPLPASMSLHPTNELSTNIRLSRNDLRLPSSIWALTAASPNDALPTAALKAPYTPNLSVKKWSPRATLTPTTTMKASPSSTGLLRPTSISMRLKEIEPSNWLISQTELAIEKL